MEQVRCNALLQPSPALSHGPFLAFSDLLRPACHGGTAQYGKQPLRVPIREEGEALIYAAVIGRDEDGKWGVRRYEGPHTQNATKLTREAGCANLLSVRIEEPTERKMQYSLENDDGESATLATLTELHELLQVRTAPPCPTALTHALIFAHRCSCSLGSFRRGST